MHEFGLEMKAIGQVLLIGGIAGIGLPVLFALGLRSMARGAGGDAEVHSTDSAGPPAHPLSRVLGIACFAIVIACAALGLFYIVVTGFGKELSFSHIYPTIVEKA